MKRLLRLRELEEEQSRMELEGSGQRRRVAAEQLELSRELLARGRRGFRSGIEMSEANGMSLANGKSEAADRCGGLMEMVQGLNQRSRMQARLRIAENELAKQQEEFLRRRSSRRQVETLADEAREAEKLDSGRRAQQMLDDWYGRQNPGQARERATGKPDERTIRTAFTGEESSRDENFRNNGNSAS